MLVLPGLHLTCYVICNCSNTSKPLLRYHTICFFDAMYVFHQGLSFVVYSEFQLIHELCLYVLSASQRTELIQATLSTLHAFLSWIPLGYIFESPLVCKILSNSFQTEIVVGTVTIDFRCQLALVIIVVKGCSHGMCLHHMFSFCYALQLETLLKFFPMPSYRNLTLQCLTEVCC